MTYKDICSCSDLVYGTGEDVVVILGWTPFSRVRSQLATNYYACAGPLYFPDQGVDRLVRNLLYNKVRKLLILNLSPLDKSAGSNEALLNFFQKGVEESVNSVGTPCWRVIGSNRCVLGADLSREAIDDLRAKIYYEEVSTFTDIEKGLKRLVSRPPLEVKEYYFPYRREVNDKEVKAPFSGQVVKGSSLQRIWFEALYRVVKTGRKTPYQRGGNCKELINLQIQLTGSNPPVQELVDLPEYFPSDKEFILRYCHELIEGPSATASFTPYTYWGRMRQVPMGSQNMTLDQIQAVITCLKKDINSNRAVISLWAPLEDSKSDSPPCLNHIWFKVHKNKLNTTVTFRSNDVFAALPHNLMGMRFIQDYVASALKVKLGTLTYNILSAHIREDNFLEAEAIVDLLNDRGYYYNTLGIYKEDVHSGSFLIAIEEQTITVVYKSYDSNSFMNQGTSAEFLTKQVLSRTPWITAQHAAYLGRELQKAEYCLKNGCEYKQS